MYRYTSRSILLFVLFAFLQSSAFAAIASNCTISPAGPINLSDSIPPQAGVELFVYAAQGTNVQYTFECDVTEQPAAVVALPAHMDAMTYTSGTGKLSITFTHVDYVAGSSVPAPPGTTTFSIALIPAAAGGAGIPAEMRGSWMATNIPPVGLDPTAAGGWELIPPTLQQPFFGYQLNGPAGAEGFFQMFIPESMRALLESLINLTANPPITLEWSDLAIFNDNQQASISIVPQPGGGALVDIQVVFSADVTSIPNTRGARITRGGPTSAGIDKNITVGQADAVSLTADDLQPSKGQTVTLYGWAQDCTPGELVKLTSNLAQKKAKAAGGKKLAKYKKNGWKRVTLGQDCGFSQTYAAQKTDVFKAIYKAAGQPAKSSGPLKITPAK